jgi:hypothetical protein
LSGLQLTGDAFQNACRVAQDVIVPEAENAVALSFQEASTLGVVPLGGGVLAAIKLNDQLRGMAGKVRKVLAEWDLLAPMVFRERLPHRAPQDALRHSHLPAKLTCSLDRARRKPKAL